MSKELNLQDAFLGVVRAEQIPVSIYLVNGIKLQGQIEAFDEAVAVLKNNGVTQMIYKHAMSTIVPAKPIALDAEDAG